MTSENKTNEAVEVTFVMLKIVAIFLDVLPHIPWKYRGKEVMGLVISLFELMSFLLLIKFRKAL